MNGTLLDHVNAVDTHFIVNKLPAAPVKNFKDPATRDPLILAPDIKDTNPSDNYSKPDLVPGKTEFATVHNIRAMVEEIAVLLVKDGNRERVDARVARKAEFDFSIDAIEQQVGKIRSSALKTMIGGVISGTFNIVAGGVQLGYAVKGLNARMLDSNGNLVPDTSRMYAISNKGTGIKEILNGSGGIAQGGFSYSAAMDQALQKQEEADEKVHTFAQSNDNDYMATWSETISSSLRILGDVNSLVYNTNRDIISHI